MPPEARGPPGTSPGLLEDCRDHRKFTALEPAVGGGGGFLRSSHLVSKNEVERLAEKSPAHRVQGMKGCRGLKPLAASLRFSLAKAGGSRWSGDQKGFIL